MDAGSEIRSRVRDIINDECIFRTPKGSKELTSLGGKGFYTWQFYLRRATLHPLCLQLLCDAFWDQFELAFAVEPFQVAGVESAAVPIITALIIEGVKRGRTLHGFTIRKERKTYGRQNLIEGAPSDAPVLIVDDLTSPQHNSFWHSVNAIREAGLSSNGTGFVLVKKMTSDEPAVIHTSLGSIKIVSVFSLDDFSLSLEDYIAERCARHKGADNSSRR